MPAVEIKNFIAGVTSWNLVTGLLLGAAGIFSAGIRTAAGTYLFTLLEEVTLRVSHQLVVSPEGDTVVAQISQPNPNEIEIVLFNNGGPAAGVATDATGVLLLMSLPND